MLTFIYLLLPTLCEALILSFITIKSFLQVQGFLPEGGFLNSLSGSALLFIQRDTHNKLYFIQGHFNRLQFKRDTLYATSSTDNWSDTSYYIIHTFHLRL
ncbi:hypothetical protein CPC08DRAFT_346482 [Agrocybe pediades]|nr:hypothetical protein CPC08DRAFT_346482 [Agrocybe pediades]